MVGREEHGKVGDIPDSVIVRLLDVFKRLKKFKIEELGLLKLLVWLIPCMVFLTSVLPYTIFASPDPGRETDNVPPSVEISREVIPPRPGGLTVTCPDGTVNDVVRECETSLNTGCPPNKVVIFAETGECIVVGIPVTCPDGTLAPNEADCNNPPISDQVNSNITKSVSPIK
jgi:hypothetical protein